MSPESRQELLDYPFPDTQVWSNRYGEFIMKPGMIVEFDFGVKREPSSCIFAEPDAIKNSPVRVTVRRGGGVDYSAVYEGVDITDTQGQQYMAKLK